VPRVVLEKSLLYVGYAVVMTLSLILALFVVAQPSPGAHSNSSSSVPAAIGVGVAGCVILRETVAWLQARQERRSMAKLQMRASQTGQVGRPGS
jgi:hypothetical protein